jgi:protein-S-isoprenylcysteine O-methyltransferase Ste14
MNTQVFEQLSVQPHARAGAAAFRLALFSAVMFTLSSAWAFAFLANLRVGLPVIDDAPHTPAGFAIVVNILLITAFAVHHSIMARPRAKAVLARQLNPAFERPLYVLCASLALAGIMWFWQPIPIAVWSITAAPLRVAIWLGYGLGWLLVVAALFAIDAWEVLGFRQALAAWRGAVESPPAFKTPWLYRIVRHPMQLGLLLSFWAMPDMTVGRLAFAGAMTLYMAIGLVFEERALVRAHGAAYRDYQRRVPMLLPLTRWR